MSDMWDHRAKWLWDKTEGCCAYCGVVLGSPREMTVDHVVPRSRGGTDAKDNRVPCCASCNKTKGRRPLSYLREVLQRRRDGAPPFTGAQIEYLRRHGITLPTPARFFFHWEQLGNRFPEGAE